MPADAFSDREKGFERKFQLDQEQEFRAQSRRNRLFGLWVAAKLGKQGTDADAYAKTVVAADMEKPGSDDVMDKVRGDLDRAGASLPNSELLAEYARQLAVARQQIADEASKG
jgi:hypothetical protein